MEPLAHVAIARTGRTATVTMRRPEVHNAFSDDVVRELTIAFRTLGTDESVRAIVLAGEGKSFSAGADLNWMRRMIDYSREDNLRDAADLAAMFRSIERCPKPVIARVQGSALGGGAGLVAAADIAIAEESTRFAFSEVRLGIIPAVISPMVLAKIGGGAARRYFLTGERFDAQRALQIGLVSQVVASADLDAAVQRVVDDLLLAGPEAVRAAKELVFAVTRETDPTAQDRLTAARIAERRAASEGQEGMRAFLEKRTPNWIEGGNS
ncbi:MAG: enoyl-CoA hydratase-related protein [Planctomycetota bacterium]